MPLVLVAVVLLPRRPAVRSLGHSVDPRLSRAIGTPRIQQHAGELVRLALRALSDMKGLDESLYERFVSSRKQAVDAATTQARLHQLWNDTFAGVDALLAYCRMLVAGRSTAEPEPDPGFDDLDFGELEGGGGRAQTSPGLQLGAADIGDLLSGIDEHVIGEAPTDEGRWSKVLEKVASIEYGLSSQLEDATARVDVALGAGEVNQVLALLDDTQSSASEAVHALVSAVYDAFLPQVDAATVVPGYLTSLGRALLVRRGIAQLATTLAPHNDVLQATDTTQHPAALQAVRDVMLQFVGSAVCRAMRPADRWQMVEFEREISTQPAAAARLTSEGLVKYLDSLGSINQREVLVLHDQRVLDHIREAIATAHQLADLSPQVAKEMLERATAEAQRLRGRRASADPLLVDLERAAPQLDLRGLLAALERILAAS